MRPPFDVQQFFDVFARYNTTVWPAQLALVLAALVAVGLAFRGRGRRVVGLILGALWLWMGGVYHLVFFRAINRAATGFGVLFLLEGVLLIAVAVGQRPLEFRWTPTVSGGAGAALLVYALIVYPVLGFALGHRYPATPTFGLPCPTTILTLGLLLWAAPPRRGVVVVIPLLWSAMGAAAALQLGVWQDLGLVAAGVLTLIVGRGAPRAREAA